MVSPLLNALPGLLYSTVDRFWTKRRKLLLYLSIILYFLLSGRLWYRTSLWTLRVSQRHLLLYLSIHFFYITSKWVYVFFSFPRINIYQERKECQLEYCSESQVTLQLCPADGQKGLGGGSTVRSPIVMAKIFKQVVYPRPFLISLCSHFSLHTPQCYYGIIFFFCSWAVHARTDPHCMI